MNRPLFAVLGIACFAAGWGLEAWAGASPEEKPARTGGTVRRDVPATPRRNQSGPAAARPAPTAYADGPASASVEELLSLTIPGRQFATRVQFDRAAAGMSAEQLAETAAALVAAVETPSNDRGLKDPLPALCAVVERWLKTDPAAAAEFAVAHEDRLMRELHNQFIEAISGVFQNDLETATRIMARIEGRELYIYARHECIMDMKGKNLEPKAALELIVKFDAQTRNQWHNAQTLGDYPAQWIQKDAPSAMNWALSLTPGYSRTYILRTMSPAWVNYDPAAAKAFLSTVPYDVLPAGKLRSRLADALGAPDGGAPAKNNPPH